ncbi:MAG: beta-mannosidase [Promethearchaeota archaeon]
MQIDSKVLEINLESNWTIKQVEKGIKCDALVPGSVFDDLQRNGFIEDPFYGLNEFKVAWVYNSDWIYNLKFDISEEYASIFDYKNIILRFNGIDTIAEVLFNGVLLGKTENMFRSYNFNIKPYLKRFNNEIIVRIRSPTKYAKEQIEKYSAKLNTGPCAIPGVPYLRKAQFSFGWDWGPKLPDIGIWKPVEIIAWNEVKFEDIFIRQEFRYVDNDKDSYGNEQIVKVEKAILEVNVNINMDKNKEKYFGINKNNGKNIDKYLLKASLKSPKNEIISKSVPITKETIQLKLEVNDPLLWWPYNLGTPNLYTFNLYLIHEESKRVIDSKEMRIGIREAKLIREKDEWGESFYFQINKVPIFIKGANWIPIDCFIPRGKRNGLYEMNINAVKQANMNMIRVWGGGIYEDEHFYDLCDRNGILVWQDFPFACAIYPIHNEFFENVKIEAIENIKRIRNHPSHVLWCGNNEIEQYFLWFSKNIIVHIYKYKERYIDIFERLLPNLVKTLDPSKPYWPSSPSNGSIKTGGVLNSNNPNYGDSHYWMVWHGGRSFKAYRKFNSRFMSEFGFESFPSIKTIYEFLNPSLKKELRFNSPIMENHQKNLAGNKKIMNYMKKRFKIPKKFEDQVILSQITQAEAMEYGVEHWRRNRNKFHCMGSLYWQLNDCWPVASWSSIDYFGRWKALHYFAKRFYANIFPSVLESKKIAELWVTNDSINDFQGELEWRLYTSKGKLIINKKEKINIPCCSSVKINQFKPKSIIKKQKEMSQLIIFYSLEKQEETIYKGFRLFNHPKKFKLYNPNLKFEIKEKGENNQIKIEISSTNIALYVFIDSDKYDFIASDNFFAMEPGEKREVTIKPMFVWNKKKIENFNPLEINKFIKSIKIKSLFDLLQK